VFRVIGVSDKSSMQEALGVHRILLVCGWHSGLLVLYGTLNLQLFHS
jgi:hypothetical protein